MPELRTDWLTGRSVLVAENRALRPNEFAEGSFAVLSASIAPLGRTLSTCPFCAGNESCTPPAVYEQCDGDGNWRLRVVPNAFPAVFNLSGAGNANGTDTAAFPAVGLSEKWQLNIPIPGVHEVIIESPFHAERMTEVSQPQLYEIIRAYATRLRHWRERESLCYGLVFKNQGSKAGASLTHVHSQLIALPFIPPSVEAEIRRAAHFFETDEKCAYCDLIDQERTLGSRIVFDADGFVAFCPFASLQPHEVWLMPCEHRASFELASTSDLKQLAVILHRLLAKLESVIPHLQYNLLLRTAPWADNYDAAYHWRIELLPRVNSLAGLEMAAGVHINPVPPEKAALQLRSA